MKGAKALDGKRVRLLVDLTTRSGTKFTAGETGKFTKQGVVRCVFETDDGRRVEAGHMSPRDFSVVSA